MDSRLPICDDVKPFCVFILLPGVGLMQLVKVFDRWFIVLFALTCMALPSAGGADPADLPEREGLHLFLLVGQSNMAGRGEMAEEDAVANPRVLMLTKQNQWKPAVDPIHFDKKVAGVGLGRTFGLLVAESSPEITIGLIPCAIGGSPISAWQPGGYHRQTNSHPYDDAIKRAKIAMESGTLKGILWHQGESDSKEQLAEVYEQKLHELIARFRAEFKSPEVPFIAGQMGQFSERPWSEEKRKVDLAHRTLPKKVGKTAFVRSDELGHKGDKVHFDSAAYRELGRRYAEAYWTLSGEK